MDNPHIQAELSWLLQAGTAQTTALGHIQSALHEIAALNSPIAVSSSSSTGADDRVKGIVWIERTNVTKLDLSISSLSSSGTTSRCTLTAGPMRMGQLHGAHRCLSNARTYLEDDSDGQGIRDIRHVLHLAELARKLLCFGQDADAEGASNDGDVGAFLTPGCLPANMRLNISISGGKLVTRVQVLDAAPAASGKPAKIVKTVQVESADPRLQQILKDLNSCILVCRDAIEKLETVLLEA
ncbi:MAG: hypothetical protein SGCHY_003097 [Lobulomycetales sp.]